jgi:hypothetical protein
MGWIIDIYTASPEGILYSVIFTQRCFKNKVVETERVENKDHVQKTESNNARTKGMRGRVYTVSHEELSLWTC